MSNNGKVIELKDKQRRGRIILNEKDCRGCDSCMLACSFHRFSVFSKELSSIKISSGYTKGYIEDKIDWSVDYNTCDLCLGEKNFLCVEYCPYDCLSYSDENTPSEG